MGQNLEKSELVSKRNTIYFFIAYLLGGFPWWIWVKPIVPSGGEYYLLFIQVPAFVYALVSAWNILKRFHESAIQVLSDTIEAENYKKIAKEKISDAELYNEKAKSKLQEAEAIVAKAKLKYPQD